MDLSSSDSDTDRTTSRLSIHNAEDDNNEEVDPTVLSAIPDHYHRLLFRDLKPSEDYADKFVLGKAAQLYPLQKRPRNGFLRKMLLTEAFSPESGSISMMLTVFLFNELAENSEGMAEEDLVALAGFTVENLTLSNVSNLLPIQVIAMPFPSGSGACSWWFKKETESQNIESDSIHSPEPKRKKKRKRPDGAVHETAHRSYTYVTLNELRSSLDEKFNVYGVIKECRLQVKENRRHMLDLHLCDPTKNDFHCMIFSSEDETFPNVHPGDIIRIHRLEVENYRGCLSGKCLSPKFVVVFEKEDKDLTPKSVAMTFVYTENDKTKVKRLMKWAKMQSSTKLISEIRKEDSVNIICQVIGVYTTKSNSVRVSIWDGTKTNEFFTRYQGYPDEKSNKSLLNIARDYFVYLWVKEPYCGPASELTPGQFIEVRDAKLYCPKPTPDEPKLMILPSTKEDRGVFLIDDDDERVLVLKERLENIREEVLKSQEISLADAESFFLSCDISALTSTQNRHETDSPQLSSDPDDFDAIPDTNAQEFGNSEETVTTTTETTTCTSHVVTSTQLLSTQLPPTSTHRPITSNHLSSTQLPSASTQLCSTSTQPPSIHLPPTSGQLPAIDKHQIISITNAGISQGQSTQAFGGVYYGIRAQQNSVGTDIDTAPEVLGITSGQTISRQASTYRDGNRPVAEPVSPSSRQSQNIFGVIDSSQENWWDSVAPHSVTLGHSDITPSLLTEVASHPAPHIFRVMAAVLNFQPETNSIKQLIRLYCPSCQYLSADASPDLPEYETREGLPIYLCPNCSDESPRLEYTYLITFSMHDGTDPAFIKVLLWRHHATKFFRNISPEEALQNASTAYSIFYRLWEICPNLRPNNYQTNDTTESTEWRLYPILDCCIMSYRSHGITKYQMIDTILNDSM